MAAFAPPHVPAATATLPPGRVDYECADGRRVLVLYQPAQAIVRIERHPPVVVTPQVGRPNVWRSDAYEGGPFILARTGAGMSLVSPGWPDTTCRR